MLFNSISFLLLFAIFLFSYHYFSKNYKLIAIFLSLFFYGYWNPNYIFVIIFISIHTCFFSYLINLNNKFKVYYLILSISISILLLVYFKYFNFLLSIFLPEKKIFTNITLPIGLSFLTFQSISFLVDTYQNKISKQKYIDIFLYIVFFPQVVAGPILRGRNFFNQLLYKLKFNEKNFLKGFLLIFWGYYLKVCLADNLGQYVDTYYSNIASINFYTTLSCIFLFSFQIYGDFAGYSLIAIGIFKLININIPINFNLPYNSISISEFWKRWHISLSSFFRDYLYIPLGGSKKNLNRTYINIFFVMLVAGLWHGASYMFIIWGALHGILIILEKKYNNFFTRYIFSKIYVFVIISLLWIPFRLENFSDLILVMNNLTSINLNFSEVFSKFDLIKNIFLILLTLWIENFYNKKKLVLIIKKKYIYIYYSLILFLILFFGNFNEKDFIYFQF